MALSSIVIKLSAIRRYFTGDTAAQQKYSLRKIVTKHAVPKQRQHLIEIFSHFTAQGLQGIVVGLELAKASHGRRALYLIVKCLHPFR